MQTGSPVRSRVPGLPGRDMIQNVKQFLKCPQKHMTLHTERKLCGYLRPTSTREEPLTRNYQETHETIQENFTHHMLQKQYQETGLAAKASRQCKRSHKRSLASRQGANSRSPFQTRLSFTSCPEILFRECGAGGAPVSPGGQPPRAQDRVGENPDILSPGNCSKTSPGSI